MAVSRKFCCFELKTCGMIVGILGIMLGILSCISSYNTIASLAGAISLLATYILVLIGVANKSTGWLLAGEIFLGLQIALNIIGTVIFLVFDHPDFKTWMYQELQKDTNMSYAEYENRWFAISITLVVVIVALTYGFFILSFVVIHRLRQLLNEKPALSLPSFNIPKDSMPPPSPPPQVHVNLYGPSIPQQSVPSALSQPDEPFAPASPDYTEPPHFPPAQTTDTPLYPNIPAPTFPSQ